MSSFAYAYLNHRAVDEVIRGQSNENLYHLRRFVKAEHLPSHLKNHSTHLIPVSNFSTTRKGIIQKDNPGTVSIGDEGSSLREKARGQQPETLHFLICATSILSYESAFRLIESLCSSFSDGTMPKLRTVTVPIYAPISEEQATDWSRKYWPMNYKKNNPFGAHPSILSHAEHEMQEMAREWMGLARDVGKDSFKYMIGEPVGAVVVEKTCPRVPSLVVVAGDARWNECERREDNPSGNVMAHAVMRAIGLVARKRRFLLTEQAPKASEPESSCYFMDMPLTSIEAEAYAKKTLAPNGYLCLGLELYVTHEPCVMCTMAILHSRFKRIVFGERLPRTGGVSAEGHASVNDESSISQGLRYGLFWRPDLNWKLPAWQLIDEDRYLLKLSNLNTHA